MQPLPLRLLSRHLTKRLHNRWLKWQAGGADWAGPISASQDDGSTERGWNIQSRCLGNCQTTRRIEFPLSTEKSRTAGGGVGSMAYLGTPNSAARCTFDIGEPEFAELSGRVWSHLSVSYDGSVSKMWIDGVLKMQDSTTSGGKIVYPPATYTANQGGWFTIGAYHDANEYYSFPGAIDELKLWHVAQDPSMGCNQGRDSPDLNYYWQFNDNPPGVLVDGTIITGTVGPDAIAKGAPAAKPGKCGGDGDAIDVLTPEVADMICAVPCQAGVAAPLCACDDAFKCDDAAGILSISVTGAGADEWNGVYNRVSGAAPFPEGTQVC